MTEPTFWRLRKKRNCGTRNIETEIYNARQHMRCVETRPRYQVTESHAGPTGLRNATRVASIETAQRVLPPVELAAYAARHYDSIDGRKFLVSELEEILANAARRESWNFHEKPERPMIPALAELIVDQWLSPSKYWREREINGQTMQNPIASSFALKMGVTNKTWHVAWKIRFHQFNELPERWYSRGEEVVNSSKIMVV